MKHDANYQRRLVDLPVLTSEEEMPEKETTQETAEDTNIQEKPAKVQESQPERDSTTQEEEEVQVNAE